MSARKPLIIGLGGTTRDGSSSEQALRIGLTAAEAAGAQTQIFAGHDLILPMYDPDPATMTQAGKTLVDALRKADGVLISSPCYHGGVSGLIKNAIDYTEEMRADPRVYFDGLPVGLIGVGYGFQGPGTVLQQLRQIVHALRGWPAPLGVAINSAVVKFSNGECSEPAIAKQIEIMAKQVADFAVRHVAHA